MKRKALTNSKRGAVATGATATGVASLAATALGAVALGAVAVGALAIGRLSVGRARLRRVEIDELAIRRLTLGGGLAVTAVARVRATAGAGDALERMLAEMRAGDPAFQGHRSQVDPELFLLQESFVDEAAFERQAGRPRFGALLVTAREEGLVAAEGQVELEVCRAI